MNDLYILTNEVAKERNDHIWRLTQIGRPITFLRALYPSLSEGEIRAIIKHKRFTVENELKG